MTDFAKLICGQPAAPCLASDALSKLSESLTSLSARCVSFLATPLPPDARLYGPFCARALLENACAAIVGRIDPFRLMYLAHFQAQEEYDVTRKIRTAFNWSGDVISLDKPNAVMWNCDHEISKISRALFSQYVDALFWRPAIYRTIDTIGALTSNRHLDELKLIEPDSFIERVKGRCNQIYPLLSKGIHFEFFEAASVVDEPSLRDAIKDVCILVAQLGLISHFMPTAYGSLEIDDAVRGYNTFRERLA